MKIIEGGVCAAKGYKANGIHCGIRANINKKDLALVVSDVMANAAAVYTRNLVKGAPIYVSEDHLKDGRAQAIIVNSGNANTCNADGIEIAKQMTEIAASATGLKSEDFAIASTGVIGQPLNIEPIKNGIDELAKGLSYSGGRYAAEAIMTTDTYAKEAAVEFELGGKTCTIGGMAKGSGMIHPDMATMLVFITTDAAVSSEMLQKAISNDVKKTFNMMSVDGDTSTNDTLVIMANGMAGNAEISAEGEDFDAFMQALNSVTVNLCKMVAGDGEGATKLLECLVSGAKTEEAAKKTAKSIICSSLVKAAMFGSDANWGRVLCAIGYADADVDVDKIDVSFKSKAGTVKVCENGTGIEFSEETAKEVLSEKEIDIVVELNDGSGAATAWGCDLTYDYVRINGDYRS
ncbi:MAG: bifunctional glutamate N-acetyltransferase/amino-acid acetyltransferase ArgJ [Mogibacterium sp.]|nr:bifunctional glutamate N-acetyltransferase/amino-acid acetyltransferase ArgJ [Mogibacterium sp.]